MMGKNNKQKSSNIYTVPFATPVAATYLMKNGGQQELLDQMALSPDANYNEKVNDYINKIKQMAMDKVQEEMLQTAAGYDEEAGNIMNMIPMAQKGMQFNNAAYATVDAFRNAAKPKYDMGKGLFKFLTPTLFANAYNQNADPLDQYYVKGSKVKDLTAKDLTKAQAGKVVGSSNDEIVRNPDGSITVYRDSDGSSYRYFNENEFNKNYKPASGKEAQKTGTLPTTSIDTPFTINPDLEKEAGKQTGSSTTGQTEKATTADNKTIPGSGTKPVWQPTDGYSEPVDVPANAQTVTGGYNVGDGYDIYRNLIPNAGQRGALMRGDTPEAFFAPDTVITNIVPQYRENLLNFLRKSENKKPGSLKSININFGTLDPQGRMVPFGQAPDEYTPIIPNERPGDIRSAERAARREERRADRDVRQEEKAAAVTQKFEDRANRLLGDNTVPSPMVEVTPEMEAGINASGYTQPMKYGGNLGKFLKKAQDGLTQQGVSPSRSRQDIMAGINKMMEADLAQEEEAFALSGPANPTTEYRDAITDPKTAEYKLGKKNNPFAAPAILAGMNMVAGALDNRQAMRNQEELRNRLSFDQMSTVLPGSQGDYAFNTGAFRPDQMVPVQFTGYNNPMSQLGGAFEKDSEYYLDDNTIQAILAAGGEIEYLD